LNFQERKKIVNFTLKRNDDKFLQNYLLLISGM